MRPPICDKTAPPHLENPGSATDCPKKGHSLAWWIQILVTGQEVDPGFIKGRVPTVTEGAHLAIQFVFPKATIKLKTFWSTWRGMRFSAGAIHFQNILLHFFPGLAFSVKCSQQKSHRENILFLEIQYRHLCKFTNCRRWFLLFQCLKIFCQSCYYQGAFPRFETLVYAQGI